jgi:hypothetical protein
MRQLVLVGVLVWLAQVPGFSQDKTVSTASLSLQGTWASQIALPGGGFVPFAIDTFSAEGAHIGINQDPTHSPPYWRLGMRGRPEVHVLDNILHPRRQRSVQRHR